MISQKLFNKFQVLEMLAFPEWQKANEKQRLRITEELGKYEGQLIINKIKKEANQLRTQL